MGYVAPPRTCYILEEQVHISAILVSETLWRHAGLWYG